MTTPDRPHVTITVPGQPDLLSDTIGVPERAPRRSDWRRVAAAAIGVAGVGVAGTGIALAVALSGGGAQPEQALPADVFALAKVDLDPSADQKFAALALAERYPDLDTGDVRDLKDSLLGELFEGGEVDYGRQVAPWIGDRAAVAVRPDADGDEQPDVLLAVGYADREAAERLIPELIEQAGKEGAAAYAFSPHADYVLLAPTQEAADAAAEVGEVLADDEDFRRDLSRLDGDQVAVAWADLGQAWSGIGSELRELARTAYGEDVEASGRYVSGVHLERNAVEVSGRGVDLDFGSEAVNAYLLPEASGAGLAGALPEDAAAAVSVAGLGEQMAGLLELSLAGASTGPTEDERAAMGGFYGVDVPDDLPALFGSETALGVYDDDGELQIGVRTRSDEPSRGAALAQQVLDAFTGPWDAEVGIGLDGCLVAYDDLVALGEIDPDEEPVEEFCGDIEPEAPADPAAAPGQVEQLPDGVAFATSDDLLEQLSGRGDLGGTELYRRAVGSADGAASVGFVDVQRLLPLLDLDDPQWLEPVQAVGGSAEAGSEGRFRLRVLFG